MSASNLFDENRAAQLVDAMQTALDQLCELPQACDAFVGTWVGTGLASELVPHYLHPDLRRSRDPRRADRRLRLRGRGRVRPSASTPNTTSAAKPTTSAPTAPTTTRLPRPKPSPPPDSGAPCRSARADRHPPPTARNLVSAATAPAHLDELAWEPMAGYPGAHNRWTLRCQFRRDDRARQDLFP
ncbi:hypothetical protein ACFW9I_35205 [[Kitasatospora] papulosa]|uniref:hypothetical protein n=1 Tax=[Kitasatospora] papulosa TaxID=1464011 RepID=UPI0036C509E2